MVLAIMPLVFVDAILDMEDLNHRQFAIYVMMDFNRYRMCPEIALVF
jgi:hypothetical protein